MSGLKRIAGYSTILIFVSLLMFTVTGRAQTVVKLKSTLDGANGQLAKNAVLTVTDSLYFDGSKINSLDTPYRVKNIITLKINEYAGVQLPSAFTAEVAIRVIYTKPDYHIDSIDRTLSVNYLDTSTYTNRSSFVFNNAHKVTVKVLSLTTTGQTDIKPVLQMDNEMQVFPVYKLSCANDAVKAFSLIQPVSPDNADELRVGWNAMTGADVYDLEWTYIDSSALNANRYGSPLDPKLLFKNNASRVTIATNSYNIPLLYDNKGVLYFRVRAVQEREHNIRIETKWSTEFGGLGVYAFDGHQDSLNWQATTNFAEEGKRKSVVQYYDGSLRGRQTVTKDNSTNTTIVGETFYDYQGRPSIQVLPAPTLNSIIKYSPGFNKGINSPEYDKDQYDTLPSPAAFLTAGARQMSDNSGANQYYSPNNPDTSGFNKFIPDAEGYAFTETVYTQDNTGRVSRQSGVGPVFRIGGNHETEYYYGSPGDGDLDALFGTDVGDKSHYFKNMVRDANGQYAVSYVDMHGRTIATALAGRPDSVSLSDLSSYMEEHVVDSLSHAGSNIVKDLTLEHTQSQLVALGGDYDFKYQLNAPVIKINSCGGTICFNGLYDLEIRITDDAYNQRLGGSAFDTVFHNYSLDSIKAGCNIAPRNFNIAFSKHLPRGNYEITKRLTVNRQALEYYRDSIFMKLDTCVTLEDFIQQQRALLANEQCIPDCKSCMDSIGSWSSFWAKYPERIGQPVSDTAVYRNQALSDYNRAIEACSALCRDTSDAADILAALLMDVSSPSGQYADANDSSIYSIFYRKDDTDRAPYQRDDVYYLDESGLPDLVYNDDIQAYVKPQKLSPAMFAAKFKPSWAAALVKFHPEYYKYQAYLQRQSAYDWAKKMEAVDNYAAARDSGYLNPTGNLAYPFTIVAARKDPMMGGTTLVQDRLERILSGYNNDADPAKQLSLWSVATMTVKCENVDPACRDLYKTPAAAFSETALCEGDRDMAWRAFRQLYLSARGSILDEEVANIGAPAGVATVTSTQLIAAGKSPRFNTASAALSQNGLDYLKTDKTERELTDSINKALLKSYDENCNAYVTYWMQQLAPCHYDYNSNDWNILKSKLLQVCKEGSDTAHPLGASSVRPSSSYRYRSFQEVLNEYNSTHNIENPWICNAYLITTPAPYDKQPPYADKLSYTRPSDCECNQLSTLKTEYGLNKKSSDINLAAYLNRTRGTSFTQTDIQALLDACSLSGATCQYLVKPISIPTIIQCNTAPACASCTEVKAAYDDYVRTFPGVSPLKEEADSTQRLKNELFARYMNNRLGFGKEAWEYLNFLDTCALSVTKDSLVCKNANPQYYAYEDPLHRSVVITDIIRTPDNGFLLGGSLKGSIDTTGNSSRASVGPVVKRDTVAILVKVNQKGGVEWAKNYGVGSGNYFSKIRTTREGGYVAIGSAWGVGHDSSDIFVVKTDKTGGVEWGRKIGFNTENGETGWDIIQTSDDGYAFAGRIDNDYVDSTGDWLIGSLDAKGFGRWMRQLGNSMIDEAYSLAEDHDTLIVLGSTFLVHSGVWHDYDVVIVKMNKNTGVTNRIFRYDFGSAPGTNNNYPRIVQQMSYGYLFNVTNGLGKNARNGLVTILKNGAIISSKQISNPLDSLVDLNMPVVGMVDGGIVTAQNVLMKPYSKLVFNKINADTTLAWSDLISLSSNSTYLSKIIDRPDGGYVAGGTYGNSGLLIFPPVSGRLTCSSSSVNSSLSGLRVTANMNGTMSINQSRGADSAVLPITVSPTNLTIELNTISCGGVDSCYKIRSGPLLCGGAKPIFGDVIDSSNNCSDNEYYAISKGTDLYNAYRDSLRNSFGNTYADSCMRAGQKEVYTLGYNISEYHYTLYYYDQAGNLLKTVPPAGVVVNRSPSWISSVRAARAAGVSNTPAHTMVTDYRYNTLNQVITQHTPDAGTSQFWYDRLGRLAVSQNAKQQPQAAYSYTQYDPLGRITEVGEISSSTVMDNVVSRSQASLSSWLGNSAASRTQITRTTYDVAYSPLAASYLSQANLRNRVSWTALYDSAPEQDTGAFATATFYSYDIHGNVDTLLQDYKKGSMAVAHRRFKKVVYRYDLTSGKVNHVAYQPGEPDAFYHRYTYDAENRLTDVETSNDSVYWEKDAFYQYYKHGPLARAVIGQQQVQGIDYAYTLQGWLKGVNSTAIGSQFDMGHDGTGVAKDVFGFALHYYGDGDYKSLGKGFSSFASVGNVGFKPLFNGNIGAISQSISSLGTALQYVYNYDVLNRLKGMQVSRGLDSLTNRWTPVALPDFKEDISYDANGNILTYKRNGDSTFSRKSLAMDDLTYNYKAGTNKLTHVQDRIDSSLYSVDIDSQSPGNYEYDSIGNLTRDNSAGISSIEWTVYGKIKSINKGGTLIKYTYDVNGNRISKNVNGVETWYVRDATGNVMAVYQKGDPGVNGGGLARSEVHLYGSSRLGVNSLVTNLEGVLPSTAVILPGLDSGLNVNFTRGSKVFELSNHLGNVLATVSDKKWFLSGVYKADVRSAQEYYPFGMQMVGRGFNAGGYRYGFNGKENDNEVKGEGNQLDFRGRIYDPRIGRWLSIDPQAEKMPGVSPYSFVFNAPLNYTDPTGELPNPIHVLYDILRRNFRLQTTSGYIYAATRAGYFSRPENSSRTYAFTRLGRIYEDAVLRSLGEDKNNKSFRPSLTSPKVVIPDYIHSVRLRMANSPNPKDDDIYDFKDAAFMDVKFKGSIAYSDEWNPTQIRNMIDVLSNLKGGTINGKWFPELKASDYGVASLTLVTPANTVVDPDLISYATEKNVLLFQRATQQDVSDPNRIRVAPLVFQLNTTQNRKTGEEVHSMSENLNAPGQSVKLNYDKR